MNLKQVNDAQPHGEAREDRADGAERLHICGQEVTDGVGIARGAYAATLSALKQLYGHTPPDEVTFALADLRGQILQGRLLLFATAREVDNADEPSRAQIGIMKQACTDLGLRVSLAAARILGPYGDLAGLGVERYLRDAKVTQIYDGTNEVQRLLIGRDTNKRLKGLA